MVPVAILVIEPEDDRVAHPRRTRERVSVGVRHDVSDRDPVPGAGRIRAPQHPAGRRFTTEQRPPGSGDRVTASTIGKAVDVDQAVTPQVVAVRGAHFVGAGFTVGESLQRPQLGRCVRSGTSHTQESPYHQRTSEPFYRDEPTCGSGFARIPPRGLRVRQ